MLILLKKLLKYLIPKRSPKSIFPDISYTIEPIFTIQGVTYYSMNSQFNLPYERAIKTISFYTELSSRVDDAYLDAHLAAEEEIYKSNKIDIFKLHQLHKNLVDRRKFIIDIDLVYKLASVVYFDDTEDPKFYDPVYAQKKIDFWKKHLSVNDFFYSAPVLNLIPFLKDSKENLQEYSKVQALVKAEQNQTLINISRKV